MATPLNLSAYEHALDNEREKLDLAAAPVFDANKHLRGPNGKFRKMSDVVTDLGNTIGRVAGGVTRVGGPGKPTQYKGGRVTLADGHYVDVAKDGRISVGHPTRAFHYGKTETPIVGGYYSAAEVALNESARHTHPDSLGGAHSYDSHYEVEATHKPGTKKVRGVTPGEASTHESVPTAQFGNFDHLGHNATDSFGGTPAKNARDTYDHHLGWLKKLGDGDQYNGTIGSPDTVVRQGDRYHVVDSTALLDAIHRDGLPADEAVRRTSLADAGSPEEAAHILASREHAPEASGHEAPLSRRFVGDASNVDDVTSQATLIGPGEAMSLPGGVTIKRDSKHGLWEVHGGGDSKRLLSAHQAATEAAKRAGSGGHEAPLTIDDPMAKYRAAAQAGRGAGRSKSGNMRNFKAMRDTSLNNVTSDVIGEGVGNDLPVAEAIHAEHVRRGTHGQHNAVVLKSHIDRHKSTHMSQEINQDVYQYHLAGQRLVLAVQATDDAELERAVRSIPADELALAADSMAKASTPEPWSSSKTSNWVARGGGLPAYIQHISHDLHEKRGKSESVAIAMAVGIVKRWCRGGGKVDAKTKAAACKAVSEWEALKARAHAKK